MTHEHITAPCRGLRIVRGGQSILRRLYSPEGARSQVTWGRRSAEHGQLAVDVAPQSVRAITTLDDLIGLEVLDFQIQACEQVTAGGGILVAQHLDQETYATIRALDLNSLSTDADGLMSYRTRLQQAIQINHPHVLRVLGCEQRGRFLLLVTERCAEMTLAELLARDKVLSEERALTLVQGIAEALATGLEKGICHGGVCPAHILVSSASKAILCNFCWDFPNVVVREGEAEIVRFEDATAAAATLTYRAPENVVNHANLRPQHDIYALGMTLYHMITGRPLFHNAADNEELLWMHKRANWMPPQQVNPALGNVTSELVMAMLASNPAQSLQDYSLLLLRLESAILHLRSRGILESMKRGLDQVKQSKYTQPALRRPFGRS